jgi:prenyltransferase beta subunit
VDFIVEFVFDSPLFTIASVNLFSVISLLLTHMLSRYTLMCAQQFDGGLRDKPSKSRDFYHTCYNLSGLSASQHLPNGETLVWGSPSNLVNTTSK